MKDIFFPEERAILHTYFRIPKPDELRNVRYWADDDDEAAEGEAPVAGPILVRERRDGHQPDFSLHNAVARIALSAVQGRLPQWAAVSDVGMQLGRERWKRKGGAITLLPQFLFEINWGDSGPGFSWPERYHYTAIPGFDRCVVTASVDSEDLYGYTDIAIGWFPADEPWRPACRRVITKWWHGMHVDWHQEAWAYLFEPGLVSDEEANEWRWGVWPDAESDYIFPRPGDEPAQEAS